MKSWLKRAAYVSGVLPAYFRVSRANTLTAVMFHRVLADDDPRWVDADPEYTVNASFFAACLDFFARHYTIVRMDDVLSAVAGQASIQKMSLLITFDDGWADNLHVAAPLLVQAGMPAVVFIAAESVLSEDDEWWQDRLFGAYRDGSIPPDLPQKILANSNKRSADSNAPEALLVASALASLSVPERNEMLSVLPHREKGYRMMLRPSELADLSSSDIAIGVHGYSHAPLTLLSDPGEDIRRAKSALAALGEKQSIAFPHGRYTDAVLQVTRDSGFRAIFTSDPYLNNTASGLAGDAVCLGRIPIAQPNLVDTSGGLDRSKLAAWLWRRPVI